MIEQKTLATVAAIILPLVVFFLLRYIFHPALVSKKFSHDEDQLNIEEEKDLCYSSSSSKAAVKQNEALSKRRRHMLSIVIPAYNEEERLPIMLNGTLDFLQKHRNDICKLVGVKQPSVDTESSLSSSFEIIIVDDGSTDGTIDISKKFASKVNGCDTGDVLRLIKLKQNRGKGAAVRAGMLRSNGELVLMADADGATEISDVLKILSSLMEMVPEDKNNNRNGDNSNNTNSTPSSSIHRFPPLVGVGSRAHLQNSSKIERTQIRTFLMHGFHFCVSNLCSDKVKDTQCGFKLFTRVAALALFSNLHLERWAFDIELITMTDLLDIPVLEVGVNWKEVDGSKLDTGSKLNLILVSVGMLRDMLCVRLCYSMGIWKLKHR